VAADYIGPIAGENAGAGKDAPEGKAIRGLADGRAAEGIGPP